MATAAARENQTVRAMVLREQRRPLEAAQVVDPEPGPGQVAVRVAACGVCRTDLHVADGDLHEPKLPLVLGHQVVGEVADEGFCVPLPPDPDPVHAAPLLCAGLIGYRALRACGDPERVGLYGFGASAHIVCQVAAHQGRRVFALTRPGDAEGQAFARELGAEWAGDSEAGPPEPLDAAIIFAPVGALVPAALRALDPGGVVVCAGIHMSDIPAFPYEILWGERQLRSVANLTRRDGEELIAIAPQVPVRTEVTAYPLEQANDALAAIRDGTLRGAAVLEVG